MLLLLDHPIAQTAYTVSPSPASLLGLYFLLHTAYNVPWAPLFHISLLCPFALAFEGSLSPHWLSAISLPCSRLPPHPHWLCPSSPASEALTHRLSGSIRASSALAPPLEGFKQAPRLPVGSLQLLSSPLYDTRRVAPIGWSLCLAANHLPTQPRDLLLFRPLCSLPAAPITCSHSTYPHRP